MKKFLCALCILCLLCPAALAAYYEGYTMDGLLPIAVYPIDSHTVVARCWPWNWRSSEMIAAPNTLIWLRDGQTVRSMNYYLRGATGDLDNTSFLSDGQGGFRVLLHRKTGVKTVSDGGETGQEAVTYQSTLYDWTEEGLQNPVDLPDGWHYLPCGTLVAAWREADTLVEIRLLDLQGNAFYSSVLPGTAGHALQSVWPWPGGYLIRTRANGISSVTCVENGQVRWQTTPVQERDFFPDGAGGFFTVVGNRNGNYEPPVVIHYGADGRQDMQKVLKGDRLVKQIQGCVRDEETGQTLLYGYAVANSRRVYTVFRLTLDQHMNLISQDVRELDAAYRDYSPRVYLTPDGFPWVLTWATGVEGSRTSLPSAIVPFDSLPVSTAASLTWQEAQAPYRVE